MIHTEQLTRHFVSKKETVEAVKGVDIDVDAGRAGGLPRAQRRGQVDHPADADHAAAADLGHGRGGRRRASIDEPALVRSRIGYIGQGNGGGHSFRVRDELVMQGRFYGHELRRRDAPGRTS